MKGITVWITQVEPRNTATKKVGASGFPHWERMDFSSSAWIMQRPAPQQERRVSSSPTPAAEGGRRGRSWSPGQGVEGRRLQRDRTPSPRKTRVDLEKVVESGVFEFDNGFGEDCGNRRVYKKALHH
ncbi:hypothetical protein TrRE_jg1408 [Triparma retinervis]|uniref:Uncharacterized protein n=1 Tax=Triparma retinervis TaxID=2557542 RepID=A0A9W7ARA3_9STRA|nr:hypothetical protein TrRE_jg1408 [Triparma retinervis]